MDSLPHLKRQLFSPLLQSNRKTGKASQSQTTEKVDYGALLYDAEGVEPATSIVAAGVAEFLSRILCVPVEDIEITKPAHSYGGDSLMAVDLRFWRTERIKADLSIFDILANNSILILSHLAASKSGYL